MLPQEEVNEQLQLLATYRRTLATCLRQQAAFGAAYSPPSLLYSIAEARSHIQRIKAALRAAGLEVPDDIDDEEPPPPVIPRWPKPARIGLFMAVIGAALLLAIGAALGSFGRPLLSRQEPATPPGAAGAVVGAATTPASSAPSEATPTEAASSTRDTAAPADQAAEPTAEPTSAQPFAEYTFANGTNEDWDGEPPQWQVVQDGANHVYQAQAPEKDYTAAAPPYSGPLADLQNYAVEMRMRIIQPDVPDDDLPTLWLSLRSQYPRNDNSAKCDAYDFALSLADSKAAISLTGKASGCDRALAQGSANLAADTWHTIRAEVNGEQLTLYVDGTPVTSASDAALKQGSFYITVGPGATVQFADIRVDKL